MAAARLLPQPISAGARRGGRVAWRLRFAAAAAFVLSGSAAYAGTATAEKSDTLDRVALAVDGAESSHGMDIAMWRADPDGPQGPMQVSAAAAADVGAGNRFDPAENRALGRAYLARLHRRYSSWADAVAAYNWGPGHMDAWIDDGRPIDKFPAAVARYRVRVLSSASAGGRMPAARDHAQQHRSLADLRHPSHDSIAVEELYTAIMRGPGLGR